MNEFHEVLLFRLLFEKALEEDEGRDVEVETLGLEFDGLAVHQRNHVFEVLGNGREMSEEGGSDFWSSKFLVELISCETEV